MCFELAVGLCVACVVSCDDYICGLSWICWEYSLILSSLQKPFSAKRQGLFKFKKKKKIHLFKKCMLWAAREDSAEAKRFVNKVAITLSVFWWALAPSQLRDFLCSSKCCNLPLVPRTSPPSCWGLAGLSPFLSAVPRLLVVAAWGSLFLPTVLRRPPGKEPSPPPTRVWEQTTDQEQMRGADAVHHRCRHWRGTCECCVNTFSCV